MASPEDNDGGAHDRGGVPEQVQRRRVGSGLFWKVAGILGFGHPVVDREKMYGDDSRNDPYSQDYDPKARR